MAGTDRFGSRASFDQTLGSGNHEQYSGTTLVPTIHSSDDDRNISRRNSAVFCKICERTVASSSEMKCHMRSHTGEKPYKCDVCGVSFALVGNLNQHTRSHTGERPFVCNVCGSAFTRSTTLRYHMRKHL